MKYKTLDDENVTDQREFRNFKITLVIGLIAAAWALKPTTGIERYLVLSLISSISFLTIETIRIFMGIEHSNYILDKAFQGWKQAGRLMPLDELEVEAGLGRTWLGVCSGYLYYFNFLILTLNLLFFLISAIKQV